MNQNKPARQTDQTNITGLPISVSTVTPVYAGEAYLQSLVTELAELKETWSSENAPIALVESIFVDDGSADGSSKVLEELASQYSWVRIVSLSRNFGQHAATVAGICHTSTDWVVTLDEDLQHKPSMIDRLFQAQASEAADVVYANPTSTAHGNSWRDSSSRFVKNILARITSTPQIRMFNSFRLIRGSIARAAASSSSSNTYFDIAISWFTKSCTSINIDLKDDRYIEKKESGYGLLKLIQHARRLIVSSELDVASTGLLVGGGAVLVAVILAVISIFQKLLFPETVGMSGWTSLVILVTFFSGVIIALLCIALEYLNIMVLNNLGRPTFFTVDRSQDARLVPWFANSDRQ